LAGQTEAVHFMPDSATDQGSLAGMGTQGRQSDERADFETSGLVRKFLVLAVVISGLWVLFGYFVPSGTPEDRALQGDAFGAVNALFSGLAFAGVILAILLQRKELSLQRQELQATREELSGQRLALEAQVKAAEAQRFDSIFFQMVSLHHEIVNGISYRFGNIGQPPLSGRQALRAVWRRVSTAVAGVPDDPLAVNDLSRLWGAGLGGPDGVPARLRALRGNPRALLSQPVSDS